jgi:MIP family channel proteins
MFSSIMWRRYLAEFIGTFAYVFLGCGARIVSATTSDVPSRLLVYFTFGFTMMAMVYALRHISAAPFNPAVVFGLALARRFPWKYVLPYWGAQIAGAIAASFVHYLLVPGRAYKAHYGATIPFIGTGKGVVIEAIITFFFMLVFMSTATDRRVGRAASGFAIGMTITIAGFFAAPLTVGSMNPARSLGPALFAGGVALRTVWVYWVGPLVGALVGAVLYEFIRGGEEQVLEIPEGIFEGIKRPKPLFHFASPTPLPLKDLSKETMESKLPEKTNEQENVQQSSNQSE